MTEKIIRYKFGIIGLVFVLLAGGVIAVVTIGHSTVEATETEDASASTEAGEESEAEEEEVVAIPVEVAEVKSGSISSYIAATANLVPEDEVKVLAEAEGRVASLKVEEGDRVQAGQIMAGLVRDEAEIALAKAELKAKNARMAFERAGETRGQGLISDEAFDKLEMEHSVAEQEVAEASWRLEKTVIRAPFSGRVTSRTLTLGQHVRPGDEVFAVADFDPLVARIYLPERDVLELRVGRQVRLSLAADGGPAFAGRIRQIAPVVDTATGTVKVTVEAVRPPAQVRPGAFVDVRIVREEHPAALLLPRESVIRELRAAHVFIAEDEQAVKRAVQLGLEEDEMVEVLAGVSEGDLVVVAGQGGLDEGQAIKIL